MPGWRLSLALTTRIAGSSLNVHSLTQPPQPVQRSGSTIGWLTTIVRCRLPSWTETSTSTRRMALSGKGQASTHVPQSRP